MRLWERVATVLSVTIAIVLTAWFVLAFSWPILEVVGWVIGTGIGSAIAVGIALWDRRRITRRNRARFRARYCGRNRRG